jgi:DNA-binding IclR family transcriptional regulator
MSDTTSVERAFAILEMFERERRSLSLKELSEYCGIPSSTCHTLVHTLLKRSYLYQTGRRKDLYPTRKIYDLGATIVAHDPVLQRLLPMLEGLREKTQETVILGKRHKDSVIYLEILESPQTIRYSSRVGEIKPLHSTCIGKVMLASMTPDEIRGWIGEHNPERITGTTMTDLGRLLDDLEQGKKLGYFSTHGENVQDVTAIAIPLNLNNELFGIAVAGPSHRIDANFNEIARALLDAQATFLDESAKGHG